MITSAATTSTSASASMSSASDARLISGDEFLRLLVAQLTHQDPLNPMDGTEFVSQLAQLQSVTTLDNISNYLKTSNIGELYSSVQQWQGVMGPVATIGRTVHWFDQAGATRSGEVNAVVRDGSGALQLVVGEDRIAFSEVQRIE